MHDLSTFQIVAAVVVGVLSVARTARLLVWDDFPPVAWVRSRWDRKTHRSEWNSLFHCPFCVAPYLALGMLGWALWSGLGFEGWGLVWWLANGWWGASYLAAMVVAYDGTDD